MAGDSRLQKKIGVGRHKSAMKRHRQSVKRNARNTQIKSITKTSVKKVRMAVTANDKETAAKNLRDAISTLHKAASKGVIPKKRASRLSSRLAKAVSKVA